MLFSNLKSNEGFRPIPAMGAASIVTHSRQEVILLVLIMHLAALLMLLFLGEKSIWLDEALSIYVARLDFSGMLQMMSEMERGQTLYTILLHYWSSLGTSEFIIRSLSVVFALGTVPLVYLLGARLFGASVGITAALLLAVNASFIHYAQEARGYSLALLLVTAASLFFVKAIERPSKSTWAGYIVTGVLAAHAHLFAVLVLVAHMVSVTTLRPRQIPWKGLLISGASIFLILVPLALFVLTVKGHGMSWITQPSLVGVGKVFAFLSGGGILLLLAYFVLCTNSLIFRLRTSHNFGPTGDTWRYSFLLAWLFVPIMITLAASFVTPVFVPRYLIVCLPPLVLLASVGLSQIPRRWIFAVALTILLLLSGRRVVYWYKDYQKENWRGACNYVLSKAIPGDAFVSYIPFGKLPFNYYLDRASAPSELLTPVNYFSGEHVAVHTPYGLPEGYFLGGKQPEPDEHLPDRLADGHNRVWLVLTHDLGLQHLQQQSQLIRKLLQSRYDITSTREFYGMTVFLYERTTPFES